MIGLRVDVKRNGPVFDGRAAAAAHQMAQAAEEELADVGKGIVLAELGRFLQHPTGYYESQIRTDRSGGDSVVTDGGVVYGPWLAGTGSRNYPETRFRGYPHWRRATQRVDRQATRIAERVMPRYLDRMG